MTGDIDPLTRPSGRLEWLDALRGLAVFLVVLGHSPGLPSWFERVIFAWHIPVFFWLTGAAASPPAPGELSPWLWKKLRTRMTPYLIFALLSYVLWVFVLRHAGSRSLVAVSAWIPAVGILYGTAWKHMLEPNIVLWFFPCLFCVEAIHALCRQAASRTAFPAGAYFVCITALLVTGQLSSGLSVRPPWSLDTACTAAVFYAMGAMLHPRMHLLRFGKIAAAVFCIPAAVSTVYFALENSQVAMIAALYGNSLYFYLAAVSGIAFSCALAMLLERTFLSRLLQVTGRHSLVIFSLHLLVFPFFTAFFRFVLRLPPDYRERSPFFALIYALLAVAVLVPVSSFLQSRLSGIPGFSSGRRKQP